MSGLEKLDRRIEGGITTELLNLLKSRAEIYYNKEDFSGAIEDYTQIIDILRRESNPNDAEIGKILKYRGDSYFSDERFSEALKDLNEAIELGVKDEHVFNLRGLTHRKLRKFVKARDDFSKAVELGRENKTTNNNLATFLFHRARERRGEFIEALSDLSEAIRICSNEDHLLEFYELKVDIEERFPSEDGSSELDTDYYDDLGYLISRYESKSKKASLLKKRVDLIFGVEVKSLELYSNALCDLNILCSNEYQMVKLRNTKKRDYFFQRAQCHEKLGNYEKCGEDVEKYLKSHGRHERIPLLSIYEMRRRVNFKLENFDEALNDANECIRILKMIISKRSNDFDWTHEEIEKKRNELYFGRGDVYIRLKNDKNIEKALEDFTHQFLQVQNDRPGIFNLRIVYSTLEEVYYKFKNLGLDLKTNLLLNEKYGSKLLKMYDDIEKRNGIDKIPVDQMITKSERASLLRHIGHSKFNRKSNEEAIEDFEASLVLEEGSYANYMLCRCCYRVGKYEEAIEFGMKYIQKIDFSQFFKGKDSINKESTRSKLKRVYQMIANIHQRGLVDSDNNSELDFYYSRKSNEILPDKIGIVEIIHSVTIPNSYKKGRILEGGYMIDREKTEYPSYDVIDFVFAHISGYIVKDREEMKKIVLGNVIAGKDGELIQKMIEKEFGDESLEDWIGRIKLIQDSGLLATGDGSLKIKWGKCEDLIRIPLYFIDCQNINSEVIIIDEKFPKIEEEVLLKCLFGVPLSYNEILSSMTSLSVLFRKLKMKNHLFVLSTYYVNQLSLKDCVRVFSKCIALFERFILPNSPIEIVNMVDEMIDEEEPNVENQKKETSSGFKNILSLSLFNKLVEKTKSETELHTKYPVLLSVLDRIGYLSKIQTTKPNQIMSILEHHDLLGRDGTKDFANFKDISLHYSKNVFESKEFSNLNIFASADKNHLFPVHKEILIMRSNFFFQMFKFPGREASSSSVEIENHAKLIVAYLLDEIYGNCSNKLSEMDLKLLFDVLVHSEMYNEVQIKVKSLKEIDTRMRNSVEEGDFVMKILEIGSFMDKLPAETVEMMIKRWNDLKKNFNDKLSVEELVDFSIKTARTAERMSEELESVKCELEAFKRKRDEESEEESESDEIGREKESIKEERPQKRRRKERITC